MESGKDRGREASAPPAVAEELCLPGAVARDAEALLRLLAGTALSAGFVHAGFEAALLAREAEFPTGLPGEPPLAIPHADARFVRRAALGVATLRDPVFFRNMGEPAQRLPVRTVFLLLVRDAGAQLPVLMALSALVQASGWEPPLHEADSPARLAASAVALLARAVE